MVKKVLIFNTISSIPRKDGKFFFEENVMKKFLRNIFVWNFFWNIQKTAFNVFNCVLKNMYELIREYI